MGAIERVFRGRRGGQERPAAAIVAGLWRNGEQGVWYDPSDLSTMFQDSAGTTPVYQPGQGQVDPPIGLQLDKRRGLTRGPEMLSNGDFSGGAAGWGVAGADATHVVDFTGGACRYRSDTTSPVLTVSQGSLSIVAGRWYELTIVVSSWVSGGIKTDSFSGAAAGGLALASSAGTFRAIGLATSTTSVFSFLRNAANTDLTIDSISIRELPGNHRWQGTATSRPTLSARYNLLTATEDLKASVWQKSNSTAPTPSRLVETTAASTHYVSQPYSAASGTPMRFSVRARPEGRNWIRLTLSLASGGDASSYFDLSAGSKGSLGGGSATITPVGDGSYICTVQGTITSSNPSCGVLLASDNNAQNYTGDGTSGVDVLWSDLRPATDGVGLPPYQRVVDANTYDTVGFPLYRKPDGADDWMQTGTVDFSGTDKITVAAAVRKTGTTRGMILELPLASGAFLLQSDEVADTVQFRSGASSVSAVSVSGQVSPVTRVYQCVGDIANDTATIRVNGVTSGLSSADQGTGAFGSGVIYFDRRNGSSLPWSGRDYGTLVVGRLLNGPETAAVEKLLRSKSRAY